MEFEKIIIFVSTILLTLYGLLLNASVITTDVHYFIKTLIIVGIGGITMFLILMFFRFEYLKKGWVYIVGGIILIALLAYVDIFGKESGGARRWIYIGSFSLQVSEFVKVYLILMISYVIYNFHKNEIIQLIAYLVVIIMCILIYFEPDLGMTIFIFTTSSLLFFIAGLFSKTKIKMLLSLLLFAIILIPILYHYSPKFQKKINDMLTYQSQRVKRFKNTVFPYKVNFSFVPFKLKLEPVKPPHYDEYAEQSNIVKQAIENATWLGSGLSQGYFTKFLPERENDYITVLALEELGILGVSIIGVLFLAMFISIIMIGLNADSVFTHYVVIGIGFVIFIQALLHFGVNFQVLPEKGISLPFVSYGGSSYLSNIIMVSIVLKARTKG